MYYNNSTKFPYLWVWCIIIYHSFDGWRGVWDCKPQKNRKKSLLNTYMELLSPKKKIRETNFLGPKKSSVEWTDLIDSFVLRCLNFFKLLKMKHLMINYCNFSRGRRAIIILFVVRWSYPKKQLTFRDSTTGFSLRMSGTDDDTDDVSLPKTGCASDWVEANFSRSKTNQKHRNSRF